MIILDVRVPALDKTYNFSLEERANIGELIEEITELIKQKEGQTFCGAYRELALFSVDRETMLNPNCTLSGYGIQGGDELILL